MAAPVSYYSFLKTAWIGLKDDPCVVSMSPAVENVFSHGTEVSWYPQNGKKC
jgi:hypothetical protein